MIKALQNYGHHNNSKLPQKIVVFRDGVGGKVAQQVCRENELKDMEEGIEQYYKE